MFEKVNSSHPDKIADRIAGAIVDMAYEAEENPRIAVEVLIGHGRCFVICESSVVLDWMEVKNTVNRIAGTDEIELELVQQHQDEHLARNQDGGFKCGDNGIFKGCPVTDEQRSLAGTMRTIYETFPYDGKAVLDNDRIILCQSNAAWDELVEHPALKGYHDYLINPLGSWTGGPDVDTGATNRKLGSDMGDAITGGGIHGKDLSKADVSVNIACHLMAQRLDQEVTACCAIGDAEVTFLPEHDEPRTMPYPEVVEMAREYVERLGGFERLAEWGLV
jgi:S-adenosylmethionine synthetase